jgi:hypothetical protein
VTNLGANAFGECYPLAGVYFKGNPPAFGANVIASRTNVTVYYMPGTAGWGPTYAGIPTALWNPVIAASDGTLGAHAGQFGFNITGTSNISVVVESCTNLAGGIWSPLQTLTLTNGTVRFAETLQTNAGGRYYQLATP